jgi:cellulose synthase/poly-beta-1,6-N-acetylglucosamine synthase-like glycosyltransferase
MNSVSYILPIRSKIAVSAEFCDYVNWLSNLTEVVVVDGSADQLYRSLAERLVSNVRHIRPDADLSALKNGKVRGVISGLRRATHEYIIIADDDVRYTAAGIRHLASALTGADVVRPQNYFRSPPWHAVVDTARTLINRVSGGDWPGTIAVRRSMVPLPGGYDGDVLFENLELVRTVEAAGGKSLLLRGLFVERLPPRTLHFWSQRVRQAYDEFARPWRMIAALVVLPLTMSLTVTRNWLWLVVAIGVLPIALAECGRRVDGGARVFAFSASLCAPIWVIERGICAWLALAARVFWGGVPYHGTILIKAANSQKALAARQFLRTRRPHSRDTNFALQSMET